VRTSKPACARWVIGRLRCGRGRGRSSAAAVAVVLVLMALGASSVEAATMSAPGPVSGLGVNVAVHPLRIMALGSSSTVGQGSMATAGFRGPLERLLARDGIAFEMVGSQQSGPPSVPDRHHEGHGGWSMAEMQPLLAGWLRAQHPDLVLLQVGTNDLAMGVSAEATAARLDAMITTIHDVSGAAVIVAGVWAPLPTHAAARAAYPALAAAVVARHRSRHEAAVFCDTSALLGSDDFSDGLHPNVQGYRKIAIMWEEGVRAYVASRSTPDAPGHR
jgi:acyl-CoA thioesterase I